MAARLRPSVCFGSSVPRSREVIGAKHMTALCRSCHLSFSLSGTVLTRDLNEGACKAKEPNTVPGPKVPVWVEMDHVWHHDDAEK